MEQKNALKLMSLNVLKESNVVLDKKTEALNFIREASEEELMLYTLTEKPKKLTEKQKQIVSEHYLLQEGGGKTFLSVLGLINSPVLWFIYRTIAANNDECMKMCGTYKINTTKRQQCLEKCQQKRESGLRNLKSKMNCNQSKNPKKCMELKNKIK